MACLHPIRLYNGEQSEQRFVGCGKCPACRKAHRNMWTLRLNHEMEYFQKASFLTLTYSNEYVPEDGLLDYADCQKFLKRFRKYARTPIKYFAVGEYGKEFNRPHWHLVILGWEPSAQDLFCVGSKGNRKIYRSARIEMLWPYGFNTVAPVGPWSMPYMLKYMLKPPPKPWLKIIKHMSGGFGKRWCMDNAQQLEECLSVKVGNQEVPIPRYYVEKLNLEPLLFTRRAEKSLEEKRSALDMLYPDMDVETKHRLYRESVTMKNQEILQEIDDGIKKF